MNELFSEFVIKDKVLVKTKHKFKVCSVCQWKVIMAKEDICLLCFWKKHKNYTEVKHLLKHGIAGEGWYEIGGHFGIDSVGDMVLKNIPAPEGYTMKFQILLFLLFKAVLNCGSLNKNSKCKTPIEDSGIPEFWLKKFNYGDVKILTHKD